MPKVEYTLVSDNNQLQEEDMRSMGKSSSGSRRVRSIPLSMIKEDYTHGSHPWIT